MAGFKEYQMLFQLNASMGGGFQSTFTAGATSVTALQQKINDLNKTQSDIASYQKQQSAIEKTKSKIDLYATQLHNLQNATASSSKEEAELANAIAAKDKQLQDATSKLDQQNAALSETGNALRQAGVDTTQLANESARLKTEAEQVAQAQKEEAEAADEAGQSLSEAMEGAKAALEAAGIVEGLKAIYSALSDCSSAAAEFESSMAAVRRTTGGDDNYISNMGESFKALSTQMPITATELAGIATTAGQLGIAQENVESFTTVMAQLATTTDLTADDAATMLAQFANITGVTDYERLGSTVAALGDSTATTASKVVEMSQGMAAAANLAGMSETDILAISAAVGSLGIEAAAGSTSMSQLISMLYKATETGNQLEEIAAVAGMTGAEFKAAWGNDAVGAMNEFITGLTNVERNGKSAVVVLDELGINNVRQTKAILGLASAGDLLSNTIAAGNAAWNENTALAQKAGVMYNTTEAKLTMLGNAANNVKIAVGDALNPAIGGVSVAITNMLQPLAEWLEANPAVVQGLTAAVSVLGIAAAGIVGYTAAVKLAAAANALFAGSIPGIGVILGVAAAIGVAVGVISALTSETTETAKSFSELDQEYDDLMTKFEEQSQVSELIDQYREVGKETENLHTLMKNGFTTTVSVKASESKLTEEDFIDNTTVKLKPAVASQLVSTDFLKDSKIALTPEQASFLASKDFISGGLKVSLTPEQAQLLTSSSFLRETKVKLTPEQKSYLKSDDFINGKKVIELTPEQASKLQAAGFLDGTTVELTAEQANSLAANGFLDNTEVQLTAIAAEKLKASEFMAEETVTITGEAGNTLTAADFGISEQTLLYIAKMDSVSYADVQSQASSLRDEVLGINSQLTSAQSSLAQSQQLASALETKINNESNRGKKAVLQQQLEDVNKEITKQEENVERLQVQQDNLSKQYTVASTAASELSGKEAELLSIKQALAGVIPDVTQNSEDQAAAYLAEADAAEQYNNAILDNYRDELYRGLNKQHVGYVESLAEEAAITEKRAEAQAKMADVAAQLDNYAESTSGKLQKQYDTTLAMYRAEQGNSEYTPELIDNMATLKNMVHDLTGEWYDLDGYIDTPEYTQMFREWISDTSELSMEYAHLKKDVDGYNETIASCDQTQQAFIDNIVNGVNNGAITLEELPKFLEDTFAGEENSAQLVESVIAEVEAQLNAAAEAAENYAEAEEQVAEMSEGTTRSVDDIITDLKDLQKEYDEAYKAAYSSMSGQFSLFEDASKSIKEMNNGFKGGTKGMTKGLDSQTKYIEQYTANFTLAQQKLAEAGVSAETAQMILSSLSDGSSESGAALASIASGSTEDAQKLAQGYQDLQSAKEQYAALVAETETDFSSKLTALSAELEATVAGMDKSGEAAAAAASTLSAYVNAADGYVALASSKYGAVAAAAVSALKAKFGLLGMFLPGFASGTKSAPKGMALVGEEGPELVYFNGGETVVPADETQRIAEQNAEGMQAESVSPGSQHVTNAGSTYSIQFSPQYHVEAGVNAEQLKSVLQEQSASLRDQVAEIIDDITEDERRRNLR